MDFNFQEDIILENDKVLLRPLQLSDYDNLKYFSTTQAELWQYSLLQAIGKEGLKNYLQLGITARQAQKEYPFIVWDKTKNQYAGSTRFYDIQLSQKCLQLGYTWYGKEFQGTGLNHRV
jgi:N-acetyltransferase